MSGDQEPVPTPEPLTDAELDAVSGGFVIEGGRAGIRANVDKSAKHYDLRPINPAAFRGIIIEGGKTP